MDKIEKATDVGKIHYPFVSQTDGFGVTIEKRGMVKRLVLIVCHILMTLRIKPVSCMRKDI